MGVFNRIAKMLEFLKGDYSTETFDIWASLACHNNLILPLPDLFQKNFYMKQNIFVFTGFANLGGKSFQKTEYPLTEELGEKVYKALQVLALRRVESEYQEKEKEERERKKKEYLNIKLFGQAISFMMED